LNGDNVRDDAYALHYDYAHDHAYDRVCGDVHVYVHGHDYAYDQNDVYVHDHDDDDDLDDVCDLRDVYVLHDDHARAYVHDYDDVCVRYDA